MNLKLENTSQKLVWISIPNANVHRMYIWPESTQFKQNLDPCINSTGDNTI